VTSSSGAPIRVALPRGDLRTPLAEQLREVGFVAQGYGEGSRVYRFEVDGRPGVEVRVFADEDVPIQVALGNYDLAICSRTWVDELLVRYRHDSIVPLRSLDLPSEPVVIAGAAGTTLEGLAAGVVRVATEYPNLAHHVLSRLRIPNYRLFEVWAQSEAWPPDDAELAIGPKSDLEAEGLEVMAEAHRGGVWLIGNRESLSQCDLDAALAPLLSLPLGSQDIGVVMPSPLRLDKERTAPAPRPERETFRIAVPDGHAQRHTAAALAAAGIEFEGYEEKRADRRPRSSIEGVEVKVIRPQDMPRAVALGGFDLALTGQDWLGVFRSSFPSAPIDQLCDLRRSNYELGAVVPNDLPAETIAEAVAYWRKDDLSRTIRLASEYASLADQYARDKHLGRYRVIPLSGASEGFVPEDAEILIEGTETGETLRANGLRMLDVMMNSTNCAIGHRDRPPGRRGELRDEFVERLRGAADDAE
jgi:ATP phosphoribosyltransferase